MSKGQESNSSSGGPERPQRRGAERGPSSSLGGRGGGRSPGHGVLLVVAIATGWWAEAAGMAQVVRRQQTAGSRSRVSHGCIICDIYDQLARRRPVGSSYVQYKPCLYPARILHALGLY